MNTYAADLPVIVGTEIQFNNSPYAICLKYREKSQSTVAEIARKRRREMARGA